jgi:hypothetical protein
VEWRGEDGGASPLAGIPNAPRTPSPRARALIFRYQGLQFVLRLIGMLLFFIGLAVAIPLNWNLKEDLALDLSSKPAVGRVLELGINSNVRINSRHPTVIRFRYTGDDGGELFGESSTINRQIIAAAIVGADIPLDVHAGVARVRGTHYSLFGMAGLAFLAMPFVGLILWWIAARSNRREVRAFTDGKPIVGQVTFAGEDHFTRVNGRHPLQIKWEFTVAGERYTGSISAIDRELMGDLMQRKLVPVLYDAMNPRINTVWVS